MYENVDYYLIIDFEATCSDDRSISKYQMEIIEIGAVIVDARTHKKVDEFESFVKPMRNPFLKDFCTELTSITQSDVDTAEFFPDVIKKFKKWLYQYSNFIFCSWGDYDKNQLIQDCAFHNVSNPISSIHINIKREFSNKQLLKKKLGMAEALSHVGLELEGRHHRGIDDVRNMARLIPFIFDNKVDF